VAALRGTQIPLAVPHNQNGTPNLVTASVGQGIVGQDGGGIYNECRGTLNGADGSGAGADVTSNTPDQIFNLC
jgi:hypothetical protein